nr:MAG TPA: portal protein [Caudoviricetes sp.]
MLKAIQNFFKPKVRSPARVIRGRFDAAQTTHDNARHWAAADYRSADADANEDARKILRVRARYEINNNSYARGIVETLANDCVGTGPRLQMLTGNEDLNRQIERDFAAWCEQIRLPEKLRTVRIAQCQDGETFLLLAQNPNLPNDDVKLDVQLIEADRVTDEFNNSDPHRVDGITFDEFGNLKSYRVLKYHPGSEWANSVEATEIPAENMIHVFRADRPGQHRGIPEITPALPLFAQLRRFTLAVLSAAEAAADFAGILYTDAPANGEADSVDAMDTIQLERNMLLTMPGGWKMSQLDPKQPSTTYAEFKREILNEIARCLNMPFNVAAGNSSGYNYASGRLDWQTYFKSIRVYQSYMEAVILNRIFDKWLREYCLAKVVDFDQFELVHTWFWDGIEHVDPAKEASAQQTRLGNLTTTLAAEYAKQGKDWEVELRQIAKERKLLTELGITAAEAAPANNTEEREEDERTE